MKKIIFLVALLTAGIAAYGSNNPSETSKDSVRLAELDQYWAELSRAVQAGDFEAYKNACHQEAVVVFATGKKKFSLPISNALSDWKTGFDETRVGNVKSDVKFRFSQRIGSKTTAHETGIFYFSTSGFDGQVDSKYVIHFEALLIKQNGVWLMLMEYQKSHASEKEWEALK
ncbi:MAG: hypothetical protein CL840_20375 [Crocinitomicaceae bacterium]|nr:hypothetical protein [Crocinitomicaceae bacterium]|tara:strand:- start:14467 stop:14982 length:516 start_codon:yes stop_codon:yes gene_type:complete